jgi:hypothetical protein
MNMPLPQFSDLIQQRLSLLRRLAESLEVSQLALVRNEAAASRLVNAENATNATLSALGRISQLSLFDYLK